MHIHVEIVTTMSKFKNSSTFITEVRLNQLDGTCLNRAIYLALQNFANTHQTDMRNEIIHHNALQLFNKLSICFNKIIIFKKIYKAIRNLQIILMTSYNKFSTTSEHEYYVSINDKFYNCYKNTILMNCTSLQSGT